VVTVHTCGKALGTAGALVCGPSVLNDFLVNRGRAFIFSTAPSPLVAAVTRAALELCARSDGRREQLERLVHCASRAALRECGLTAPGSHVMPIVLGEDSAAAALAATLRRQGFDVRAIRPPTVPVGTARLRVAVTLNVDEIAIESLFATLARSMEHRQSVTAAAQVGPTAEGPREPSHLVAVTPSRTRDMPTGYAMNFKR